MPKVAIVISHPIQHFCPQYASFAKLPGVELKVFFGSRLGADTYTDTQFNTSIKWDNLYLDNFPHIFLSNDVLPADKNLDSSLLNKELTLFKPDYVIVNGYAQKLQRRAYNWANINKIPIFYISDSELSQKRIVGLTYLKKAFLLRYFKKIAGFLTVGDSNEFYYKYYGVHFNKMHRNFFPIDVLTYDQALLKESELKENLLNKYNLHSNDFFICTVGKLISFKRQIDVIKALKELEHYRTRRIVYFVIGSGPDLEKLEALAKTINYHKIIFTGFTKPEALPSYYLTSDIYVHPSEIEPHSLSVSEAIYCGCPVLLSDRCGSFGPTDDVQDGYNGFTYSCGDIKQLSKYILFLINNQELKTLFSKNSSELGSLHQGLAHGQGLLNAINASQKIR